MYRVEWTTGGSATLTAIRPKSVHGKIIDKADTLAISPDQSGKPLKRDLVGFRKISAAGRYRIIYQVDSTPFTDSNGTCFEGRSFICAVGIRKDGDKSNIYDIASAMLRRGELGM